MSIIEFLRRMSMDSFSEIKKCETPQQLREFMYSQSVDISEQEAEELFVLLPHELDDDRDLEQVAAGIIDRLSSKQSADYVCLKTGEVHSSNNFYPYKCMDYISLGQGHLQGNYSQEGCHNCKNATKC